MAYQKLQASRAIAVIPSDTVDIPNPATLAISSTTTGTAAGKLIDGVSGTNSTDGLTLTDASKNFVSLGVKVGDTVENTSTPGTTTVTAVNTTKLTLKEDIFASSGENYSVGSFLRLGVKIGDIIYSGAIAATVTAIDSATQLSVSTTVGAAAPYKLYASRDMPNNGCVLYIGNVGGGTRLTMVTAGGDDVTMEGFVAGTFVPVQITRVKYTNTDVTKIVALW
jgi:co-chaperonin GroES (HSP10)